MKKEALQRIFTHIPTITAQRVYLRRILPKDAADMFAYSKDRRVTQYLLWEPHPDLDYTSQYLEYLQGRYDIGDFYDWAIVLSENHRMIGTCGFTKILPEEESGEVGYVLNPEYTGKGYAREALSAVLQFGFTQLHMHRIYARILEGNTSSIRVAEACGLHHEGILREAIYLRGEYRNVHLHAGLSTD